MSSSPHPGSLADRRHHLALVCEMDRRNFRDAMTEADRESESSIGGIPLSFLNKAYSIAQLLPGKIGRWARRLSIGAELIGALKPFMK